MFPAFYLLLSLGRSKFFLTTGALQNKLLTIAVRVAETDPMNPDISLHKISHRVCKAFGNEKGAIWLL